MSTIKRLLKRAMAAVAPQTTTAILSARSRAHSHRLVRQWGLSELNRKLIEHLGPTVQSGPFRGMTLSPMTTEEHLGPFLLGTYEAELHSWIELVSQGRFSQVLDVGAKFGYYAVGLGRLMPATPVIAFDTDWWARAATAEMVVANRTPNVTPAGFCSPRWLDRYVQPASFIFSDCEGYEGELFRSALSPALDTTTLLIEIHDNLIPGVGGAIRDRFRHTHSIESRKDGPTPVPEVDLGFLTPLEAEAATREIRGPQEWLFLTPRSA